MWGFADNLNGIVKIIKEINFLLVFTKLTLINYFFTSETEIL